MEAVLKVDQHIVMLLSITVVTATESQSDLTYWGLSHNNKYKQPISSTH